MLEYLTVLYGAEPAAALLPRVEALLAQYRSRIPLHPAAAAYFGSDKP